MANVSFHVGTSAPGTSGLTTGGLYFNTSGGGIYYASSATATSQVASKVSFSRSLTSGTKVGTITINGTGTDLYCQTNTDEKCAYTSSSANSEYPLLFKSSTSSTTTAGKPYFDTGITVNPSANRITASWFKGYLVPTHLGSTAGTASGTISNIAEGFYTAFQVNAGNTCYSSSFYYPGSRAMTVYSGDSSGTVICNISASGAVTAPNAYATVQLWGWGG